MKTRLSDLEITCHPVNQAGSSSNEIGDVDFSNEANERLTCSYEGDDMEIGFNSRFLLEMLNNMDTENIILELSAPNRAGILLPDKNVNGEDLLMLVMPVMLNN